MINRHIVAILGLAGLVLSATSSSAQPAETFTATASVKATGGAAATAPVTIVVSRKMTAQEAEALTGAFAKGGLAALRKALTGVAPTGSIQIGKGAPTPTRLTIERTVEQGRMLTVVTDQPLVLLGAGLPGAKPKEGYDFGLVDFVVDAKGGGKGTMSPAAKITVKQGVFVVEEYSGELVQLNNVTKVK